MFIVIWIMGREELKSLGSGSGVGRSHGRELMNRKANAAERFSVGQAQGWRGEKRAEGDKMGGVSHSRE